MSSVERELQQLDAIIVLLETVIELNPGQSQLFVHLVEMREQRTEQIDRFLKQEEGGSDVPADVHA